MAQFAGVLILLIGVGVWFGMHPIDIPRSEAVQQAAAVAVATPTTFDETGMVIFDDAGDPTGIPWIVYQTPNRPIATKQLVFEGVVACDAGARELPCAPTTKGGNYPVAPEQRIRVQGIVEGEKVLVQRITYL